MSEQTKTIFETMPDEETVARNMFSFSGDLYQESDVVRFLEIAQYDKVSSMRFVAWLVALKIIEPDRIKWMPDLMRASSYYDRAVKRFFKTTYYEPLANMADGPKIRTAIESSMEWFRKLAKYEDHDDDMIADAELRISRMMATCYMDNPNITYDFNDERLFMIAYVVALGFARRGTLTNYYAEAFAYHIGLGLLAPLATQRKIMKLGVDDDFTMDYFKLLKRFANNMLKTMKKAEVDPAAIARYYIYTMFTDAFEPAQLLCIFDTIVLKLREYRNEANYIIIAMLLQIEADGGKFEIERVIPEKPYDAIDIIDQVEAMQNTKEVNFMKMALESACPCYAGFNLLFGNRK